MRRTNRALKSLLVVLTGFSFASAGTLTATAVTVTAAIPQSGDSAAIAWELSKAGKAAATAAAEAAEAPVHIVKVYIKLPPIGEETYQLWVGDDEVREYGGFKHGIFFKVYNQDQLAKWAGKPLRMARRGQPPQALGQDFPGVDAKDAIRAAGSDSGSPRKQIKDVLAQ